MSGYLNNNNITMNKLDISINVINNLLNKLNENDRFGMVLFNDDGFIGINLKLIKNLNINEIKNKIEKLKQCGGTNFNNGYKKATQLYSKLDDYNKVNYHNRIIFLTDAMPNTNNLNDNELLKHVYSNANNNIIPIYTTFIGMF